MFTAHIVSVLAAWICIAAHHELLSEMQLSTQFTPPLLSWLTGCGLLFALQKGRLQHLPALASGGAVLAGLHPLAIVSQTAVAAMFLVLTRVRSPAKAIQAKR